MTTYTEALKLSTRDDSAKITLGKWLIASDQNVELDWNYYSKSWHRSHGPKITVTDKTLTFTRAYGRGTQTKKVYLNSWAGDFLARSADDLGLSPKNPKLSLKIRLNKAYDAKKLYSKRGYTFYSRTLLGCHIDYVIQSPLGMIYHDDDKANLVKGLHQKVRSQSRKLKGLVDWAMCKRLGFCDEGINEFCALFGFDKRGSYIPQEIEQRIRTNPTAAAPFLAELKTLATALNYNYTI